MTKTAAAKTPALKPLTALLGKTPSRIARMAMTTPCGLKAGDLSLQARLRSRTKALQFRAVLGATARSGEQTVYAGVWADGENEAIRSLVADLEQSNLRRVAESVEMQTDAGAGERRLTDRALIQGFEFAPA